MAHLKDTLDKEHQGRIRWGTHQLNALILELDKAGWEIDRNDADTLKVVRQYAGICYKVGDGFFDLAQELNPDKDNAEAGQEDDTD